MKKYIKKLKLFVLCFLIVMLCVGCGEKPENDYLQDATILIEEGKYEEAQELLYDYNDQEALALKSYAILMQEIELDYENLNNNSLILNEDTYLTIVSKWEECNSYIEYLNSDFAEKVKLMEEIIADWENPAELEEIIALMDDLDFAYDYVTKIIDGESFTIAEALSEIDRSYVVYDSICDKYVNWLGRDMEKDFPNFKDLEDCLKSMRDEEFARLSEKYNLNKKYTLNSGTTVIMLTMNCDIYENSKWMLLTFDLKEDIKVFSTPLLIKKLYEGENIKDEVDDSAQENQGTVLPNTESQNTGGVETESEAPVLSEQTIEALVGKSWVLTTSKLDRYGKPKCVTIEALTRTDATIIYEMDGSTVRKDECIGLQQQDGKCFVVLEMSVSYEDNVLVLTSEKQIREFNSVSSKKDPLCIIRFDLSKINTMDIEFATWNHKLTMLEKQEEVKNDFNQAIINDIGSLAAFQEKAAAVTADHKLYLWGYKALTDFGDSQLEGTAIEPTCVMEGVKKIFATTGAEGYVLKDDDSLWGFDENKMEKIADNVEYIDCNWGMRVMVYKNGDVKALDTSMYCKQSQIGKITGVKEVAVGYNHVLALKEDGTLWGLGENSNYALGVTTNNRVQSSYIQIMSDVVAIEADEDKSYAIKSDGSLWVWGENSSGSLGTANFDTQKTPVKILDSVASVYVHEGTAHAITKNGILYVWGSGNSYSSQSNIPVKYAEDVIAVRAEGAVLMVVKTDGNLYTCGNNSDHQLGYLSDEKKVKTLTLCLENILLN